MYIAPTSACDKSARAKREGHMEHRDGHYADALRRGKKVTTLMAEVFGGLALAVTGWSVS